MHDPKDTPEFTGEYFIPGKSGQRIHADHMARYEFAKRHVHEKTVLDIACGVGYSAPVMAAAGATSYVGVDINPDLVAFANASHGGDAIRYCEGDICTWGQGREFDVITCFETIEHVPDYKAALANLHKLLRPDGLLLISSPNRPITSPGCASLDDAPTNEFHVQEFVPEELVAALQEAGFCIRPDGLYGQRQRPRLLARLRPMMPWLSARISRMADRWSSPVPTRMKAGHDPRYFILAATKNNPAAATDFGR
jgi:SAM-dependent methyltransferase